MGKRGAGFIMAGIILCCGPAFAFQTKSSPASTPPASKPAPQKQDFADLSRDLGHGYSLGLEASPAAGNSIVTDISQLNTYSLGLSIAKADVAVKGDKLGLELSKPVHSASDETGLPGLHNGFGPETETVLSLIYSQPIDPMTTGSVSLSARQNADDIMGRSDYAGMIRLRHSF
jgi:hypothetical protein